MRPLVAIAASDYNPVGGDGLLLHSGAIREMFMMSVGEGVEPLRIVVSAGLLEALETNFRTASEMNCCTAPWRGGEFRSR